MCVVVVWRSGFKQWQCSRKMGGGCRKQQDYNVQEASLACPPMGRKLRSPAIAHGTHPCYEQLQLKGMERQVVSHVDWHQVVQDKRLQVHRYWRRQLQERCGSV